MSEDIIIRRKIGLNEEAQVEYSTISGANTVSQFTVKPTLDGIIYKIMSTHTDEFSTVTDLYSIGSNGTFVFGSTDLVSNSSTLFEFVSENKAVLFPRLNATDISTPTDGHIIYDLLSSKFKFRENGTWNSIVNGITYDENEIVYGDGLTAGGVTSASLQFDGTTMNISSAGTSTGWGFTQLVVGSTQSEAGMSFNNSGTGGRQYNIISTSDTSSLGGGIFSIGDATSSTNLFMFDALHNFYLPQLTDNGFLRTSGSNGQVSIDTVISETFGGTNQSSYTLGDILYASATNTLSKLPGNITTGLQFLGQTGTGTISAAPVWQALPVGGFLVYYFQNTASDVASSFKQLTQPYTPSTALTGVTITTNPQIVQTFVTDSGFPYRTYIPNGLYQVNIHAHKSSGTKETYVYAEIWETNSAGVDIALICTTGNSIPLNNISADLYVSYQRPIIYQMSSVNSRIKTKVYAATTGGGSDPVVVLSVGALTDSRLLVPSNIVDANNFVPYFGATANIDLNAKSISNISSVTSNSAVINGTGGAGYIEFLAQSTNTTVGSSTGFRIFSGSTGGFNWIKKNGSDVYVRNLSATLTADRTWILPDTAGTIALIDGGQTFSSATWNGSVITGQYGGTGVANTGKTITIGASLTTTGTLTPTLAFPTGGSGTYTFPLSTATLLANNLGLSGGTTLVGDILTGGSLTLSSTSHATKGPIIFGTSRYDEANNRLGINVTPTYSLDVLFTPATAATTARAAYIAITNTAMTPGAVTSYALYTLNNAGSGSASDFRYGLYSSSISTAGNLGGNGTAVGVYGIAQGANSNYGGDFVGHSNNNANRNVYGLRATVQNYSATGTTAVAGLFNVNSTSLTRAVGVEINFVYSAVAPSTEYLINGRNNSTTIWSVRSDGRQYIGSSSTPIGWLTIAANTTTIPHLSLIPSAGVAVSSPANGDIWFDGTNVYIRVGGVTKTFTLV